MIKQVIRHTRSIRWSLQTLTLSLLLFSLLLSIIWHGRQLDALCQHQHIQNITRRPHITAVNKPITRKPRCIIYDRPPRTGSTTVAYALSRCFHVKRFYIAKFPSRSIRHLHVPLVLSRSEKNFALVGHHFWMSETDIRLLEERCNGTFYMTSVAAIHDRLWSAAKVMSTTSVNGNFSVGDRERMQALEWLKQNGLGYAAYLEAYPFIDLLGPQLIGKTDFGAVTELPNSWGPGIIPKHFQYDFIFRKDNLSHDLSQILTALNCPSSYAIKNVHSEQVDTVDLERDLLLNNITADSYGQLYRTLMENAKNNDKGLQKLKEIMLHANE